MNRDKRTGGAGGRRRQGFTMLELLVVLAIIALLAAFVGPKYFAQIGKSKGQIARAQIDLFDKAVVQYRIDVGSYPTQEQGLVALVAPPKGEGLWRGPYLKKAVPLDPWERAYSYKIPGSDGREFEIVSFGGDGVSGGGGEDADVSNWQ
jgi:general secretion pathway protein G